MKIGNIEKQAITKRIFSKYRYEDKINLHFNIPMLNRQYNTNINRSIVDQILLFDRQCNVDCKFLSFPSLLFHLNYVLSTIFTLNT